MIRTYSLLKALQPTWEVHFLALQNPDRANSEHAIQEGLSGDNIHVGSFDVMANVKQKIGRIPGLGGLLQVRNILKKVNYLRPIFWSVNLPFVIYRHQKDRRVIKNKIRLHDFDAILFDYTKMAHHLVLGRNKRIKKVLNVHNVESDTARQAMLNGARGYSKAIHWLRWRTYELYEKFFLPGCDLLLAASPADATAYEKLAPSIKVVVIPNAVDTEALKRLPEPEERRALIYPGRMDYPPNLEAAHFLCKHILPRVSALIPEVRLYIVGKNPPDSLQRFSSDRVVVTGYVDDVLPFWRKAAVLVVPLSVGGGTRIKILEAMALGRPIVSTSKGCEGLDVVHGEHLLIADDAEEFSRHVVRVLRNPKGAEEMIHNARKLVEQKYSFDAIRTTLRQALDSAFRDDSPAATLD